jgi:hypothetical protein
MAYLFVSVCTKLIKIEATGSYMPDNFRINGELHRV